MPKTAYSSRYKTIEFLANNQVGQLYLTDVAEPGEKPAIATLALADLIANFFTKDEDTGAITRKVYSREVTNDSHKIISDSQSKIAEDYSKIISDPQGKIADLVKLVEKEIKTKNLVLGSEAFRAFVLEKNTLGNQITLTPRFSKGEVAYCDLDLPAYPDNILKAVDKDLSLNKKQKG
jgi:hypothetical protein